MRLRCVVLTEIVPSPRMSQRCFLVNSEYGGGDGGVVCSGWLSPPSKHDSDPERVCGTSDVWCLGS